MIRAIIYDSDIKGPLHEMAIEKYLAPNCPKYLKKEAMKNIFGELFKDWLGSSAFEDDI